MPVFRFQPIPIRSQKPPYLMAMPPAEKDLCDVGKIFTIPPDKRN
jgi:hypothetical protein